ncbi:hypothetical protein DVK85_11640 [Flavobacterium arcticum]|uniref:Uncharacterized protein n=1 Tax=Flavobacterium arcticum TaxID=1784713 RepID=A0A345HE36_9FLAO|nr:hypothetical protein [Flavobacterium arcticum]AXG74846.1 hypothetical protein DVK85_11640 [Flavobacterium arcticum]KAF2509654.1 hypothetical protein E0W72_09030 [Flavobacterium arcticum]
MKKIIVLVMFLVGAVSYAQELPNVLSLAVKKGVAYTPQVTVNFSFYNDNFTKVFGYYNYTSDNFDYGERNVYIGYNDRLYYNDNRPLLINMQQAGIDLNNINYNGCPNRVTLSLFK